MPATSVSRTLWGALINQRSERDEGSSAEPVPGSTTTNEITAAIASPYAMDEGLTGEQVAARIPPLPTDLGANGHPVGLVKR